MMAHRLVGVLTVGGRDSRTAKGRVPEVSDRVLVLSWEYPPVIEGGLARHVRKLAEGLVRAGVEVDVLTRGTADAPVPGAPRFRPGGVEVHRVPEPGWPRDLDRFVAWVEQMNEDMLAAGGRLAPERTHGLHQRPDWPLARAARPLPGRVAPPPRATPPPTPPRPPPPLAPNTPHR